MTKEQIEEASKKFAEENIWNPGISCESDIITLKESVIAAFKDGADWRINSVWHKPEEVPEPYATLLVKCIEGYRTWALWPNHVRNWESLVETKRVICWAYVEDLIPTEDETA